MSDKTDRLHAELALVEAEGRFVEAKRAVDYDEPETVAEYQEAKARLREVRREWRLKYRTPGAVTPAPIDGKVAT